MEFTDAVPARMNYIPSTPTLNSLCDALKAQMHPDANRIIAAALSYERNQREEFGARHDHFKLVGQDNVRRYLPAGSVRVPVMIFAPGVSASSPGTSRRRSRRIVGVSLTAAPISRTDETYACANLGYPPVGSRPAPALRFTRIARSCPAIARPTAG